MDYCDVNCIFEGSLLVAIWIHDWTMHSLRHVELEVPIDHVFELFKRELNFHEYIVATKFWSLLFSITQHLWGPVSQKNINNVLCFLVKWNRRSINGSRVLRIINNKNWKWKKTRIWYIEKETQTGDWLQVGRENR